MCQKSTDNGCKWSDVLKRSACSKTSMSWVFSFLFSFFNYVYIYIYLELCLVNVALEMWRSVCSLAQQLLQALCVSGSEHNMSHGADTDSLA